MAPDAPADERPPPRLLIAEDDDALRGLLRKATLQAGYEVEDVATGDAARDAYMRRCPDILLADLVLPGLNGQQLANACREHCEDAILVFMSGYSEEELHDLDIKQVVFLPKPIQVKELIRTLDRLVRDRGADSRTSEETRAR